MTHGFTQKDGYKLWMAYDALNTDKAQHYVKLISSVAVAESDPVGMSAAQELETALPKLLSTDISVSLDPESFRDEEGHLIAGTFETIGKRMPGLKNRLGEATNHAEGYYIFRTENGAVCIASPSSKGMLYGAFAFLRILQAEALWDGEPVLSEPKLTYRMLNHWDNLDGSIERGYAGRTLWKWAELPEYVDPRYTDYARACASVGINATVLNNVNTQHKILSREYLEKAAVIAGVLRKWGIKTFLSVNFASPIVLGKLKSADPKNKKVIAWWKEKTDEVYSLIPDFGGYLMKADSEGQPGPYDYGRTHADGANMFGQVLEPHGGLIIWRAFVYGFGEKDRAKKPYNDFKPIDGTFLPDVAIQVKNGPIDFMPREPVHPLFGGMDHTNLFMEFQISQEYLGQGNHIVYLGPMWKEILEFDTQDGNKKTTVADILAHDIHSNGLTGAAAVSNTGDHPDWCGSHFHPLNLYAFGRLCWDFSLDPSDIASEWLSQTFPRDNGFAQKILPMLMGSWEACIDYTTPLGLHHLVQEHHHYGPDPGFDGGKREDWRSTYYHRADKTGLGFDRTRKGSAAVDQYHKPVADMFNDIETCPEKYLLWFHHVPWDRKLSSGRSLKDELAFRYRRGVEKAEAMLETWKSVQGMVDDRRFWEVLAKLEIQAADAREWERVCTSYFLAFTEGKR